MKKHWNLIKTIVLCAALPLVATAAASAHTWLSDSNPLSIGLDNVISADAESLSSTRVHTVALNRAGVVEGRIASIDSDSKDTKGLSDLKVFFVQDGKVAKQTKTNADGTFAVTDLAEGVYSFVATGKNGFAAYGVRVVPHNGVDEINLMEAAAVSTRIGTVKQILNDKLPAEVADQIIATTENVEAEKVVGANRVRLQNGTLKGHVMPLLGDVENVEGTYVHIIQDDKQVAEVQADKAGSFMVNDLAPGVYDFVAAGPTGFAAVSFEAIQDAESVVIESDSEAVPVSAEPPAAEPFVSADPIAYQDSVPADIPFDSYGGGYGDSLDVCMTCSQDTGFVADQVVDYGSYGGDIVYDNGSYSQPIEYAGESIGCGCAAGGSCGSVGDYSGYSSCGGCSPCGGGGGLFGSGGGGLGGGRLGRLALLGTFAVGIVSIADNNDPPAQSPNN